MKSLLTDARILAWSIAVLAVLTVGGALALQWAGYSPCELCLRERLPYYAGIPVALLTSVAVATHQRRLAVLGFVLIILIFMVSAAMGFYHAGVEWKLWPGPSACSGTVTAAPKVEDFLQQLNHVNVVRCDAVALRIFGLSLTVWNALVSLLLIALANVGLLRAGVGVKPPQSLGATRRGYNAQ